MTADQLQNARGRLFRQDGRALLTADDAGAWLREVGLALFAPRGREVPAPAPTLAEAVAGKADPVPGPAVLAEASRMLGRLQAGGEAVPLLLLGGAAGFSHTGDRPDYLATRETLPFVYALRGDREWARGPRGRSSPLTVEVWKLLGGEGARTAGEIKDRLGKQLTETAALRALAELWAALRVEPVYAEGAETRWQRMEANHQAGMNAGADMGQATALSALASLYLQAAVAASGEEVESWLGALQSRSRVRETLRGLVATRQVGVRALAGGEQFYVEGSLPEFLEFAVAGTPASAAPARVAADTPARAPEDEPKGAGEPTREEVLIEGEAGRYRIEAVPEGEQARERSMAGEGRKRFVAARGGAEARPGKARPGKARPGNGQAGDRRGAAGAPGGKPFFARQPWREDRPGGAGGRAPAGGARASFGPGSYQGSGQQDGSDRERRPFRAGGFPGKGGAERKEGQPFETGRSGAGGKPARPQSDGKPFGGKPFGGQAGGARPLGPKGAGRSKGFGTKPPLFEQDRPLRKAFGGNEAAPRGEFGGAGQRGGFAGTGDGKRRPSPRREEAAAGERKPFAPRAGKPFRPAGGTGQGPGGGERRPFGAGNGRQGFTGPKRAGGAGTGRAPFEKRAPAGSAGPFGKEKAFDARDVATPEGGRRPIGTGVKPFRAGAGAPPGAKPYGGARPFRKEGGAAPPRRTGGAAGRFAPGSGGSEGEEFNAGADAVRKTPKPAGAGFRAGAAARPGGKKPRTAPFTSSGKPRAGAAKPGRPGSKADRPQAGRPGAGPRKPFGKAPKRDG